MSLALTAVTQHQTKHAQKAEQERHPREEEREHHSLELVGFTCRMTMNSATFEQLTKRPEYRRSGLLSSRLPVARRPKSKSHAHPARGWVPTSSIYNDRDGFIRLVWTWELE